MEMIFNKPLEEVIRARYSVRNYEDKHLSQELIEKIENYISELDNPFNIKVRIHLIKKETYKDVIRLGTYGVIKGANYYLVAACENKDFALEALGYTFEKLILYCTSLGLGTVWLGGTFSKGDFGKTINLKSNEILPAVSPVGYEGGKKSFLASFMKDHKNKRKDYSEVFFNVSFDTPLSKEEAKEYGEAFEMVRLAPSSMNKQPWRIVKVQNDIHIYNSGNNDMNKIDMGIALCHLDLYMKEKGISGDFKFVNPFIECKYAYVISWLRSE
ncbi:nitroreductase family protein [Clostridium sp. 1001275B_160808_H3]|uniref:nitroreductase family protein n=1 Tax=Clostridium sp. 1001275B_160808_H3 TaxID=2787110 RepID=UPI00189B6811|nr:nitroreductase family protein [Clostridium sp. 1001275B_160808_H3]